MKNLLYILIALFLPVVALGATVPWFDLGLDVVRTHPAFNHVLIGSTATSTNNALEVHGTIGGDNFVGSSTSATSSFAGPISSAKGITISSSTPSTIVNTLYNLGSKLFWNGSQVSTTTVAVGTTNSSTLRWNGSAWVENTTLKSDSSSTTVNNLVVSGTATTSSLAVTGGSPSFAKVLRSASSTGSTEWVYPDLGMTGVVYGGKFRPSIGADKRRIDLLEETKLQWVSYSTPGTPVYSELTLSAQNDIALDNAVATSTTEWIGIRNNSGTAEFFSLGQDITGVDRRTYAVIGTAWASTTGLLADRSNFPFLSDGHDYTEIDKLVSDGYTWKESGMIVSADGANQKIDLGSGKCWRTFGYASSTPAVPHNGTEAALDAVSEYYVYNSTGGFDLLSDFEVTNYDNSGTTAIPNSKFVAQRVYKWCGTQFVGIQRGAAFYNTIDEAEASWAEENFTTNPETAFAALIGVVIVQEGATALNNTSDAKFIDIKGNAVVTGSGQDTSIYNDNGTTGSGRTIGITDTLNFDSSTLYIDGTNNRIGMGTTNPDRTLHLSGASSSIAIKDVGSRDDVQLLTFGENGDNEFFFESGFSGGGSTGNTLKLQTFWGSNAMTWRGDGSVGVGTTSPVSKFAVAGDSYFNATSTFNGGLNIASSTPDVTSQMLYALGSTLYWNGTAFSPPAGGTQGQTIVIDNTGQQVATSTIFIDSAQQVGIGTTTVDGKLSIDQIGSGDIFNLYDGGANVFTVLDGGNVGVGTAAPSSRLHVVGTSTFDRDISVGQFMVHDGDTDTFVELDTNYIGLDTGGHTRFSISDGITVINEDNENHDLYFYADTGSDLLHIDADADSGQGRVGIGISAPAHTLEVDGTVGVNENIVHNGDINTLIQFETDQISFDTAGTQRLVIESDGDVAVDTDTLFVDESTNRVGIGDTTPDYELDVDGNGRFAGLVDASRFVATTTLATSTFAGDVVVGGTEGDAKLSIEMGSGGAGKALGFREATESNFYFYPDFAGGGETGNWLEMRDWQGDNLMTWRGDNRVGIGTASPELTLDAEGDIEVGTGTTGCVRDADNTTIAGTCSSDGRLKENVKSIEGALDKIVGLRPVTFDWVQDYEHRAEGTQYGLIAQEVQEVMPEMVHTDDGGNLRVAYDTAFTARIVQAIKELWGHVQMLWSWNEDQDARLEQLETENQELKERLERLESMVNSK